MKESTWLRRARKAAEGLDHQGGERDRHSEPGQGEDMLACPLPWLNWVQANVYFFVWCYSLFKNIICCNI